jgi:hypothetical protein
MSAKASRNLRKKMKERERRLEQQRAFEAQRADPAEFERDFSDTSASLHLPLPPAEKLLQPPPAPAKAPPTPAERWWEAYMRADAEGRLAMVEEKLRCLTPEDEEYEAYFPEGISELSTKMSDTQYAAFLESLQTRYPAVFFADLDWHVWHMVPVYLAAQRWQDIEALIDLWTARLEGIPDTLFAVLAWLRLGGQAAAAKKLVEAAMANIHNTELMYWAAHELIEVASFAPIQDCLAAGVTEEALAHTCRQMVAYGMDDTEAQRHGLKRRIDHLAGRTPPPDRQQLLRSKTHLGDNIYLLIVDFCRWLQTRRDVAAIVGDQFRLIVINEIERIASDSRRELDWFLHGLEYKSFEAGVVGYLRFLSLDRVRAPALIVAAYLFYDFLAEHQLVDTRVQQQSQAVCRQLWNKLRNSLGDSWRSYAFLERYWPA